jgi:hypothetical protein
MIIGAPELLDEHRRILAAVAGNERQISGARPESSADLAAKRWTFTRELLAHFANEEATLLRPLMGDARPHVAALATKALAEQNRLLDDFKDHVRRWGSLASEAEWPDYVRATRALMQRIRTRIQHEESSLYSQLPAQVDKRGLTTPDTRYVGEAAQIRNVIFDGKVA